MDNAGQTGTYETVNMYATWQGCEVVERGNEIILYVPKGDADVDD